MLCCFSFLRIVFGVRAPRLALFCFCDFLSCVQHCLAAFLSSFFTALCLSSETSFQPQFPCAAHRVCSLWPLRLDEVLALFLCPAGFFHVVQPSLYRFLLVCLTFICLVFSFGSMSSRISHRRTVVGACKLRALYLDVYLLPLFLSCDFSSVYEFSGSFLCPVRAALCVGLHFVGSGDLTLVDYV